jgi:hypothetical protein
VNDYYYAVDPAFDDNSEWISCDTCKREYEEINLINYLEERRER